VRSDSSQSNLGIILCERDVRDISLRWRLIEADVRLTVRDNSRRRIDFSLSGTILVLAINNNDCHSPDGLLRYMATAYALSETFAKMKFSVSQTPGPPGYLHVGMSLSNCSRYIRLPDFKPGTPPLHRLVPMGTYTLSFILYDYLHTYIGKNCPSWTSAGGEGERGTASSPSQQASFWKCAFNSDALSFQPFSS